MNLVQVSLAFQVEECIPVLGKPEIVEPRHAPLLHLFGFLSVGSFVHELFRLYGLEKQIPLFSVMRSKRDNISEGELEYVSYLSHENPKEYVTAFSSAKGQRRISQPGSATVIPDAYGVSGKSTGHLHFFNGCW